MTIDGSKTNTKRGNNGGNIAADQSKYREPVYILGPTASGKSALAVKLARKLDGVIISADSMQIYRGLDVGTAKESPEIRAEIPHKLIDVVDADEEYSVAEFAEAAKKEIAAALKEGKLPIVVGGTGLYFEALFYPLRFSDRSKDDNLREELMREQQLYGSEHLHAKLAQLDPATAEKLHVNDVKRVIRALEIAYSGNLKSEEADKRVDPDVIAVGLNTDRAVLYERINARVDEMFKQGLAEEAKIVLSADTQSSKAIGYREFSDYKIENGVMGDFSEDDLAAIKEKIKQDSRNYAKRQLTWFRRYAFVKWFDCFDMDSALIYIENSLRARS